MRKFVIAMGLIVITTMAEARSLQTDHNFKYRDQELRVVKSLTPADIRTLQSGGGWGFAKPAELNGMPGPSHLLKLKNEIPLNNHQVKQLTKIFQKMTAAAIPHGKDLIRHEARLDSHFRHNTMSKHRLKFLLAETSKTRETLRYIHLAAHLQTREILSVAQINRYNKLRGYSDKDQRLDKRKGHQHKHR